MGSAFFFCAIMWLLICRPALSAQTGPTSQAQLQAPDEKALWLLWKNHIENPTNHTSMAASCEEFAAKTPGDPLAIVGQGLAAWHLMKANHIAPARSILEKMSATPSHPSVSAPPEADALRKAGVNMALRWLTRSDLELVKKALQELYAMEIEYPKSLDPLQSLPPKSRPPLTDRWEKPWSYRLVDMRYIKGVSGQKYELQSKMLGGNSDLARALATPYADNIRLKPVRIASSSPGREAAQFISTGEKKEPVFLSLGSDAGGIAFAYFGAKILILSDGDHWMILPRPET